MILIRSPFTIFVQQIKKTMKPSRTILSVIMSLLLSSCVSYSYVTFDRLEAGDINYPESVKKVGVVNNMPCFDIAGLDGSFLPPLEGDGEIAADTLAHLLAASDYFEQVVICDSPLQGANASFLGPYALSPVQADSLLEVMGVDVLFSIDRVKVDLSVLSSGWNGYRYGGVKAVVTPVMFAYIPGRETPWFAVSCKDSIAFNRNETMALDKFRKDASAYSAYMLTDHLLPSWKMVERIYYASGCVEMRDANVYVMEGNWEEAYHLWKAVYDEKKGKKKMMAAFNLAVYHEAHDDTERAVGYLEEALALMKPGSHDEGMMRFYLTQLKNRIEKRKKLDMQMRRFE